MKFCILTKFRLENKTVDGGGSKLRRKAAGVWCEVLPFDEISSRKKKLLMVEVRNYGERRREGGGKSFAF